MSDFLDWARFSRDHRWAPEHMSDYLDGGLATNGLDRMQRHLAECPECRRLLSGLRTVVEALHRLPAPGGRPDAVRVAASVRARLKDPPAP